MEPKILLDHFGFPGRDPEFGVGAPTGYLYDVLQMPEALDVARIMPAEEVAVPARDHVDHRVDPLRVGQAVETDFLCPKHVREYVPTLQGIAPGADRPFPLDQNGADRAVTCRNAVRVSRHLRGLA